MMPTPDQSMKRQSCRSVRRHMHRITHRDDENARRTGVRATIIGVVAVMLALQAACARPSIPAISTSASTSAIDATCDASNATLRGSVRRVPFEPIAFAVPSRWIMEYGTLNDLSFDLRRTGSALRVWKGGEFTFTPVLPINTVECQLVRGDTTIRIRTTMLVESIRSYRVDVSWSPAINGQRLYMQLQTRFPEHLAQLRGVIESVGVVRHASSEPGTR